MSSATHTGRGAGPVIYGEAQEAQRKLAGLRQSGRIPDILWLLEHPPTVTWGASGGRDHLLVAEGLLQGRGITLCKSDRGGDVTYHEPGQLVGYLIVDLGGGGDRDLHVYLRAVEEGLIRYLGEIGIAGIRSSGRTGVWIEGPPARKIAAMGVRVTRWITSHGFALNVENDLAGFDLIVPCGIRDVGVTSIRRELGGAAPAWSQVCGSVHRHMEKALARPLELVVGERGLELARGGK